MALAGRLASTSPNGRDDRDCRLAVGWWKPPNEERASLARLPLLVSER